MNIPRKVLPDESCSIESLCSELSFRSIPARPFDTTPIRMIIRPIIIYHKAFSEGNPSTMNGKIEPTNITEPINIEKPNETPIALLHSCTPIPQRKDVSTMR